jgi:hypothetical protein
MNRPKKASYHKGHEGTQRGSGSPSSEKQKPKSIFPMPLCVLCVHCGLDFASQFSLFGNTGDFGNPVIAFVFLRVLCG